MYKMFCKSLENCLRVFQDGSAQNEYRYQIAQGLSLLADAEAYQTAREGKTAGYLAVCDLLQYMSDNIEQHPKFKAFLWTIESRGMRGERLGLTSESVLKEQAKLIQSILNMQYWS